MIESREYTPEEVREHFLSHINYMIEYWNNIQIISIKDRLEGLAFSILSAIDGGTVLPGFILAPLPDKTDKAYSIECEENWYPENHQSNVVCDIAGSLHEQLVSKKDVS